MNRGQFKDSVYYPCLAGSAVTSWSLAQEVASLSNQFYKNVVIEFNKFSENI